MEFEIGEFKLAFGRLCGIRLEDGTVSRKLMRKINQLAGLLQSIFKIQFPDYLHVLRHFAVFCV